MPVRQPPQGGVQTPQLAGYQSAGVAAPTYQEPRDAAAGGSMFWRGLVGSAVKQGMEELQKSMARGYLEGEQDSMEGRAKQARSFLTREQYEQGYNRATVSSDLAKFQLGMQNKATEYVNAGRSPEEFNEYIQETTNQLLNEAGARGLDLNDKDWQAWLGSVQSSRDTANEFFQSQHTKRAEFMKQQSISAEGNAAIATFTTAEQSGDPMQALQNVNSHVARINNDDTLSPQQKVAYTSQFMVNAFTAAQSSGGVSGLSSYMESLDEYKNMPTELQTQLRNAAQSEYQKRAADDSVKLYEYNSKMASVADYNELVKEYPMNSYINTVMGSIQRREISPSTGYSMVDAESVRRAKLQKAAQAQVSYGTGITMSDIASSTGEGLDKVKSNLIKMYGAQYQNWSDGGLALFQRGLKSGAQDIAGVGVDMLQQDAASLAQVDWRNLERDEEGNPKYSSTVVKSLGNLHNAYNAALAAGNNVQANALLSGLPDAVAYGIRQNTDVRTLGSVVAKRANDIAAGKVVQMPEKMPNDLLLNQDDVLAGMLDFGISQGARNRNLLGVQSWVFTSSDDEKAAQTRLTQLNGAVSAEYTKRFHEGTLPALDGEDMKNWLIGKVGERTVQVDDGTDKNSLLVLPEVGNKQGVFGTVDNQLIAKAVQDNVKEFRQKYPAATSVQMDYDPFTQEIIFQGSNQDNILGTTSESIPAAELREKVKGVQGNMTRGGLGSARGNLAVPSVGYVNYNTDNKYGIQTNTMMDAVGKLIGYEGYTSNKGFSILGTHPTTGAKLNEAKYVKQPEDSAQVAADKLSLYVNDKILPGVMRTMPKYDALPGFLKTQVFDALVETTYHSGNPEAFSKYMDDALAGNLDVSTFKDSPLFKDAGAGSRRNRDRMALLAALNSYSRQTRR